MRQLAVELNAESVGGSPFPLYFSAPGSSPARMAAAVAEGAAAAAGLQGLPANISREELALMASRGTGTFPQISVLVRAACPWSCTRSVPELLQSCAACLPSSLL